jgi:D-sedoheptulose 7-phosphate isomerase
VKPDLDQMIRDSSTVITGLLQQRKTIEQIGLVMVGCLERGGKILTCGNGGSAAEAMHLAEELTGRYDRERRSLPAVALTADSTLLTCIGNDYGFDQIFSRQVEGLGRKGDVLVVFTSSGNSFNLIRALKAASKRGLITVALLGKNGGKTKGRADHEVIVRDPATARVQEAHTLILHLLLEIVDARFAR